MLSESVGDKWSLAVRLGARNQRGLACLARTGPGKPEADLTGMWSSSVSTEGTPAPVERFPGGRPLSDGDRLTQDGPEPGRVDFARVAQVDLVVLADHREAMAGDELIVQPPQ